jgi:hypothetical protein
MFDGYGVFYYHGASVLHEGKEGYFLQLDDDNQHIAIVVIEGKEERVNRDTLTPKPRPHALTCARSFLIEKGLLDATCTVSETELIQMFYLCCRSLQEERETHARH